MVLALVLTLTWPFELRDRPSKSDPQAVKQAFASRLLYHTGAIVICLIGAGVGASLYVRQAREEYRREALRNLRTLVEGEEPKES
ncbi:hypothetical protein EON82_20575 [bacterium]|nr:MAG: hypothetical protein EON82_20575 [bacterium]